MKTMKLGKGEIVTSRLAMGCMRINRVDRETADRAVHAALDCGITMFDHADVYGFGQSEEIFGDILDLRSSIRDKLQIQSKATLIRDETSTLCNDSSYEHLTQSVDKILMRLKTDYLDLFLLHTPDTLIEPEETARAFDDLHRSGKVRCFGVSNHKPMHIELLNKYLNQRLIVSQLQMSVANPFLINDSRTILMTEENMISRMDDVFTYCRVHDMSIQAWSPFQFGHYGGVFMGNENFPKLNEVTTRIGKERGVSQSAVAIAWLLRHPVGVQPLVGSMNAERIKDICTGVDVELTRMEWYEMYRASLQDQGKLSFSNSNAKK